MMLKSVVGVFCIGEGIASGAFHLVTRVESEVQCGRHWQFCFPLPNG